MIFSAQERIILHVFPLDFQNADFDEKVRISIDFVFCDWLDFGGEASDRAVGACVIES